MKINNIEVEIGDKIKHGFCYPMTCSERFPSKLDEVLNVWIRDSRAYPLHLQGEGFVIGIKMAIMSDYSYTPSNTFQGHEDSYPEVEPAYASGKKEECLVVTKFIKPFRPYLVRRKDVI